LSCRCIGNFGWAIFRFVFFAMIVPRFLKSFSAPRHFIGAVEASQVTARNIFNGA
jgi:hypothetical protein